MKKLIVLSVVFALVASAAFAVDVGANVFGLVVPAQGESGDNASDDITSSFGFQRLRIDGGGEAGDGAFGGYFRFDGPSLDVDMTATDPDDIVSFGNGLAGNAWWKPIDQLKILIGGNPDGMYGKEGVTGWMFNENPYDGGVAFGGGKIWGGVYQIRTRDVFYGGFGGNALHLNITPVSMFGLNLVIPFGGKTEDAFKNITAQADVNLDFGNIAVTFESAYDAGKDSSSGKAYLYYGGSFGDLAIDFGFSYGFNDSDVDADKPPMGVGFGVKYATDAFGVKFRLAATLAGGDKATRLLADILPYFSLGDNLVAFINVGIGMIAPDSGDTVFDWSFNPYIRIGEEWGAQFLIGVDVHSVSDWSGATTNSKITWAIPIAIMVMF